MIRPIVSLDELTINKIAAGEVIERPASVVKELVENSVDAGATRITVEINNSKDYIKIVDNGDGIPKEDMKNAFERHATSKLREVEDLDTINTMGFRGEALPSIAAVSVVEMVTKIKDAPGNKLVIAGDKVFEFVPAGCPNGTSITVTNLFGNVPARKKFLKSDASENRYIYEMLSKLAIANTNISFILIINGERKLSTRGNGNLKDIIFDVYSGQGDALNFKEEMEDSLLDVNYETENLKITGLVGKPEISRSNRKQQIFYVNGRNIVDKNIIAALDLAFKGRLMPGRHAFVVLKIEIDPHFVDVNVHPAKLEVRFKNEAEVFSGVKTAIENALSTENRLDKALKKMKFDASNNLGEEYKERLKETKIEKSPKELRKEALEKLIKKRDDVGLDIKDEVAFSSFSLNNNIYIDPLEKNDENEIKKELEEKLEEDNKNIINEKMSSESLLQDILLKREKYGKGYATREAREKYKENVKNKFAAAKIEFEKLKEEKSLNGKKEEKKELNNVSDIIDKNKELNNLDKKLVKEILDVKQENKNNFKHKMEDINQNIEETNKRLKEIQNMSKEERQEYIKNKLEKYNNKYKSKIKDKKIGLKEDKENLKNKNNVESKLEEIIKDREKVNSKKYKRKTKEEELREEYDSIYNEMNSLKEEDLSKLNHLDGELKEDIEDIEKKLNIVKEYLENEIKENSINVSSLDDISEEKIIETIEKLGLEENQTKYLVEESENLEDTIKKLQDLEDEEIKKADKLKEDEVLEKLIENSKQTEREESYTEEIKTSNKNNLDFNEMYKKAFGEDVFEKRKEEKDLKEKGEEKFDGTLDGVSAENVSFFGNKKLPYKIVGTVFKTYIIIEIGQDMYMIDQHAAHERILYEEVKARYNKNENIETQMLILPDIITLSHLEMDVVRENMDIFKKMGFVIEMFGINSIKLTGVPMQFEEYNTKELFLDILDEISGENNSSRKEIEDNFLATIACKAAVKANMYLSEKEIEALLDKMLTLENPFSCPHGRPSAIKFNKNKIERKFNRKL